MVGVRSIALTLLCLLLNPVGLRAQTPADFTLAGHSVAPGQKASFMVPVAGTEIPISIIHGARPGVVLNLTAGIHGDEFPSLFALQRLLAQTDPATLSGTLVLVHLANLPGFHARRIALNPTDEKNLNREFPGAPDGTQTEQIAHFLTTEVIARTDYLMDLHSGSANQYLWPHVYSPVVGDPELDARTLAFAQATGMRHIVLYGDRPRDPANSISYPNTAQTRGKPGLTVEIGYLGRRDEAFILEVLAVAQNAMAHLGMLDAPAPEVAGYTLYTRLHEVESEVSGVFHPRTAIGERVLPGALLGEVTDYFGNPIQALRAPVEGVVLMVNDTPPIRAGEAPVTVGSWE